MTPRMLKSTHIFDSNFFFAALRFVVLFRIARSIFYFIFQPQIIRVVYGGEFHFLCFWGRFFQLDYCPVLLHTLDILNHSIITSTDQLFHAKLQKWFEQSQ